MVVGGSDCGSLFIWERATGKVLRLFKADEYSVNTVQCHPNRLLIATSGIDNVIRFWEPGLQVNGYIFSIGFWECKCFVNLPFRPRLIKNNEMGLSHSVYKSIFSITFREII